MEIISISISLNIRPFTRRWWHSKLQIYAVKGILCAYADIQLVLCTSNISLESCKYIQVKSVLWNLVCKFSIQWKELFIRGRLVFILYQQPKVECQIKTLRRCLVTTQSERWSKVNSKQFWHSSAVVTTQSHLHIYTVLFFFFPIFPDFIQ